MIFTIVNPIKAYISGATPLEIETLRRDLSYVNTANQHILKRYYNNHWLRNKNQAAWEFKLNEIRATVNQCLLFEDEGGYFVRPGSLTYLGIHPQNIINEIKYPVPKKIAWAKPLPVVLYPFQEQSVEKLINIKHGNVELCTGAGKSNILLKLCRETGFKCAIVAPSASIFNELLHKFELHLGKGNIGALGDGKRRIGKKINICIGDSLVNIKPGTDEWEFFSGLDMVAFDESHVLGAETLEKVCHGIFSNIPYRFMVSATQTRGDGGEKLLQSIIGPTVHSLSTAEAIKAGYICPHDFVIVDVESSNPNFNSADMIEMKRNHLLRNRNIAAFAAKLANAKANTAGEQTLILVEELSQIAMIIPLLTVPYAYAHSESSKVKLIELGTVTGVLLEKVDSAESVEKFNRNEVKVLIGTGCVSTGTNIYPVHNLINFCGGSSEIRTKQGAVGRGVRLHNANPHKDKCVIKTKCTIWDFDVKNIYALEAHLEKRIEYYKDSGTSIRKIRLK